METNLVHVICSEIKDELLKLSNVTCLEKTSNWGSDPGRHKPAQVVTEASIMITCLSNKQQVFMAVKMIMIIF